MKNEIKNTLSASAATLPDPLPADLQESLQDLAEVVEYAKEAGYPEPSRLAIDNADRLLREMHRYFQARYQVYPGTEGEVAIQVADRNKYSLIVLCESQGRVLCSADLESGHLMEVYENAGKVSSGFIRSALSEIRRKS